MKSDPKDRAAPTMSFIGEGQKGSIVYELFFTYEVEAYNIYSTHSWEAFAKGWWEKDRQIKAYQHIW